MASSISSHVACSPVERIEDSWLLMTVLETRIHDQKKKKKSSEISYIKTSPLPCRPAKQRATLLVISIASKPFLSADESVIMYLHFKVIQNTQPAWNVLRLFVMLNITRCSFLSPQIHCVVFSSPDFWC